MNKLLMFLLFAVMIAATAWAVRSGWGYSGFETMSVSEFEALLLHPDSVLLLDVRTRAEFEQVHISGALPVNVNDSNFIKRAKDLIPPGITVAVYCRSGKRSARTASMLTDEGYRVVNLGGGIIAWQGEGRPVVTRKPGAECVSAADRNLKVGGKDIPVKIISFNPALTQVRIQMFERPSISNPRCLLAVEAAFTGKLLEDSTHFMPSNICGDYVINGKRFTGYEEATTTTGCLCVTPGGVSVERASEEVVSRAQVSGGYLFHQILLVENGQDCYVDRQPKKRTDIEYYRSLAQMPDSSLCIVQSTAEMNLTEFIAAMCQIGVKSAIYLDMGFGWNYGWYRSQVGAEPELLFPVARKTRYQTNWLIVEPK